MNDKLLKIFAEIDRKIDEGNSVIEGRGLGSALARMPWGNSERNADAASVARLAVVANPGFATALVAAALKAVAVGDSAELRRRLVLLVALAVRWIGAIDERTKVAK